MTLSVRVTNSKLVNAFAEVELVFRENIVDGLLTADSSITADSIQLGIVGRVRDNLLFLLPGKVFAQNHAIFMLLVPLRMFFREHPLVRLRRAFCFEIDFCVYNIYDIYVHCAVCNVHEGVNRMYCV